MKLFKVEISHSPGIFNKMGYEIRVIFSPKQNEFVYIVGHAGDSFAAFLNEVIL